MDSWIKEGYDYATKNSGSMYGAQVADQYVQNVEKTIDKLTKDINSLEGFKTDPSQLQGDFAEFWHAGTFNVKATIEDSKYHAEVIRSHELASPDIVIKDGNNIIQEVGLKYYKNPVDSVNQQAKSVFQRFCEYKNQSGRSDLTIEQYLSEKNISDSVLENDPIYSGQERLIPSDQLKAAIEYLKFKIQKELFNRPEQAKRYQETLDKLTSKIKTPDGVSSTELSRSTAQEGAVAAKQGNFNPEDYGVSTEELMKFRHALRKGVEAGKSAALITLILKTAPELYKCLEKLIHEGKINEDDFRKLGFKALTGSAQGFVRGFVAGTLTTACKSGLLGSIPKSVSPNVIGALTAIVMQTMEDSVLVVKGDMTHNELIANVSKNAFIATCGIGLATAIGAMFTPATALFAFSYMLGNFVGSMVGSFAYVAVDNAFMSFAINSGWTFFTVVKQDYQLPQSVLEEIGVDVFDYEKEILNQYQFDEFRPDEFQIDEYHPEFISVIRRGVIGVHQVGYIVD